MTWEYMGLHPRTPPPTRRGGRYRSKKSAGAEEKLEDTPVVAELRVAVAKEEIEDAKPPEKEV